MEEFQRISIIGMGLIGGSIALGLKRSGYLGEIVGQDVSLQSLELAEKIGAIDRYTTSLMEAVSDADLVVIAVPIGYYEDIFREISGFLKPYTVVTDVGSVKKHVMNLAAEYLPRHVQFLGGHPMAGSEKTGIRSASPNLFENAFYFLTPTETTSTQTIDKIKKLIEMIGVYPVIIDSDSHDHIVSLISHIPHLIAGMLVNLLDRSPDIPYLSYAGGGFRDATRIASGNPGMWKDILITNKNEIIKGIEELEQILMDFKKNLIVNDQQKIMDTLKRAKEIRDSIPKHVKDAIPAVYEVVLDVRDRPGILGEVTYLMGENSININEIEIVHAREGKNGAVRMGFSTAEEQKSAFYIFKEAGYSVACYDEDKENNG